MCFAFLEKTYNCVGHRSNLWVFFRLFAVILILFVTLAFIGLIQKKFSSDLLAQPLLYPTLASVASQGGVRMLYPPHIFRRRDSAIWRSVSFFSSQSPACARFLRHLLQEAVMAIVLSVPPLWLEPDDIWANTPLQVDCCRNRCFLLLFGVLYAVVLLRS